MGSRVFLAYNSNHVQHAYDDAQWFDLPPLLVMVVDDAQLLDLPPLLVTVVYDAQSFDLPLLWVMVVKEPNWTHIMPSNLLPVLFLVSIGCCCCC